MFWGVKHVLIRCASLLAGPHDVDTLSGNADNERWIVSSDRECSFVVWIVAMLSTASLFNDRVGPIRVVLGYAVEANVEPRDRESRGADPQGAAVRRHPCGHRVGNGDPQRID